MGRVQALCGAAWCAAGCLLRCAAALPGAAASAAAFAVRSPRGAARHAVLVALAVAVQSFMLAQVTFFYLLLLWRTPRSRGGAPSAAGDAAAPGVGPASALSCVVMVRNEEQNIAATLRAIGAAADRPELLQLVLVDSGCTDGTVAAAKREEESLPFRVAHTAAAQSGRGAALDAGTAAASGEIVFVMHADCVAPPGFDTLIRQGLARNGALATCFRFAINREQLDAPLPGGGVMEATVHVRSSLLQLPFGDQGIALTKRRLREYGGWGGAAYPLMEDFQVVQRLRTDGAAGLGHIEVLSAPLRCSPRRWAKLGVWRANLANQLVMLWYRGGATPQQLFDFYYGKSTAHVPRWLLLLTNPLMGR